LIFTDSNEITNVTWSAGTSVDTDVFDGETIGRLRFCCCQFVWTCRVCNCDCIRVLAVTGTVPQNYIFC